VLWWLVPIVLLPTLFFVAVAVGNRPERPADIETSMAERERFRRAVLQSERSRAARREDRRAG